VLLQLDRHFVSRAQQKTK